jgi:hypothetical protein
MYDHYRSGAQQSLTQEQGPDGVMGGESAGVANQVRFTQVESQRTEEVEARVHAGQHCEMKLGFGGQLSVSVTGDVVPIVGE